ncbi:MAG: type III pantothenate kinase [Cyclobacteriaceae bacterium]
MNLAIDIGNTATKAGWFEHNHLVEIQSDTHPEAFIEQIRQRYPERIIVSSVSSQAQALRDAVPEDIHYMELSSDTPLPFENTYHTPHTLGTDRVAAVAGAHALYPAQNVLVIDAGTCITYELLNNQHQYLGGLISPGLRMRWQAMHTFTARLPLVSLESVTTGPERAIEELPLVGKSTQEALLSGGLIGLAAEINQMIRMYADKFAALQVVTCGGDMVHLQPWILSEYTHVPELVLIGLNSIVQYDGS